MAHDNPKVGKKGEYSPTETLMGAPCPPYPKHQIGIGNGYYVLHNTAIGGDWQAALETVKASLHSPSYKRTKKGKDTDGPESPGTES
jgi:hypothetical protein